MDYIMLNVVACSGCGLNHKDVKFYKLRKRRKINGLKYSHAAVCPTSSKTIFMREI